MVISSVVIVSGLIRPRLGRRRILVSYAPLYILVQRWLEDNFFALVRLITASAVGRFMKAGADEKKEILLKALSKHILIPSFTLCKCRYLICSIDLVLIAVVTVLMRVRIETDGGVMHSNGVKDQVGGNKECPECLLSPSL